MRHLIQYRASRGYAVAEQVHGNIAVQASVQHCQYVQTELPTHVVVNAGGCSDMGEVTS